MGTDYIVWSELVANSILMRANVSGFELSTDRCSAHEAGNYIILLAARIQAERAVAGMVHRES